MIVDRLQSLPVNQLREIRIARGAGDPSERGGADAATGARERLDERDLRRRSRQRVRDRYADDARADDDNVLSRH